MSQAEDVKRVETPSGNIIDANARITNVSPPQSATDAGTKGHTDAAVAALEPRLVVVDNDGFKYLKFLDSRGKVVSMVKLTDEAAVVQINKPYFNQGTSTQPSTGNSGGAFATLAAMLTFYGLAEGNKFYIDGTDTTDAALVALKGLPLAAGDSFLVGSGDTAEYIIPERYGSKLEMYATQLTAQCGNAQLYQNANNCNITAGHDRNVNLNGEGSVQITNGNSQIQIKADGSFEFLPVTEFGALIKSMLTAGANITISEPDVVTGKITIAYSA